MGHRMKHISHSAVLLLFTVTAVLCFTRDGDPAELGDASPDAEPKDVSPAEPKQGAGKAEGKAAADAPPDGLLTPWDQQGLDVIKAYANYNKKLQDTEMQLREKLANPPDKVEPIEYHSIPGYKFNFLGRKMTEKSRSECELICSTYSACKSYSYNAKKRKCIWAMSKVKYNMDYSIWIKKATPEGDSSKLYNELSGLFIQDKLEPLPIKQGGYIPSIPEKEKPAGEAISWDECEYQCTKNAECRTFSFSHPKNECVLSAIAMHYEPDWTYYEKEESLEGPAHLKAHQKEHEEKEELKAKWIEGSSAKRRAEAEKAAKVKKEIDDTKSAETEARSEERRAQVSADVDKGKCSLANAELSGGRKRNAELMAELEKGNQQVVDTRRNRMEAEKVLEKAKTYESKKKSELKLAVYDIGEAKNKVAQTKSNEEAEKKRNSGYEENKEKVCGTSDISTASYKTKEAKFKQAEAKQKLLHNGEVLAETHEAEVTAANELASAQSIERKSKMNAAARKATLEGSEKKSAAASTEKGKKQDLQLVDKDKEALNKAARHSDKASHTVLVHKEKHQKSKELVRKQKEKESKSEHLLKSRKRESEMKKESIRVRKKLRVKKENDDKTEHSSKLQKKTELAEKKTDEQREKGEVDLKKMTADEIKKKKELQSEEKKYKDVLKMRETNKKGEAKHKQHLKNLEQDEQDAKYKKRRDGLMKRTLSENEVEAKKHAADADQEAKDTADKATADEQAEKAATAALKKATTEADTKQLLRSELQSKAALSQANEEATKAQQQKMLAAEDLVQAVAKQQAESCVHICLEGLASKKQEMDRVQALPPNGTVPTLAPAATPAPTSPPPPTPAPTGDAEQSDAAAPVSVLMDAISLLQQNPVAGAAPTEGAVGGVGSNVPKTAAQQEVASETAHALEQQNEKEVKMLAMPPKFNLPKVEPFTYNGCECA